MTSRRVTLVSSIKDIATALREASPALHIEEVVDEALTGYGGGTVSFDPRRLLPATKDQLAAAEVLIAEPAVLAAILRHDPIAFPNLKWCQSTYAGVDPMFKAGLQMPLGFQLTRFAGKFGPPIAEWCLARMISHERHFTLTDVDQNAKEWAGSRQVTQYRYLSDLTLGILGCGDIGLHIAKAARAFGMRVVGYARTHREADGLDECTTSLNMVLQEADYLVSVLPSTQETRGMLAGNVLAPASRESGGKSPVFLNVGRGDVIDESSLVAALDRGYISAAILDVFEREPLPKESPLWSRSDVVVSPHVSGVTRAGDVPDLFLDNYKRYVAGNDLNYVVDWDKGY